ncbi:hypothetical protein O181_067956 [Austropuccinia psidii MF-1]|uniref:Uncharacterized protein n=1 Tax=Austropuccinia psidii MF-1 TaxID=1389203 RepID=A0A9Q3ETX5_9BASI|nr:hypothetical protein [Austropuccinia psidii MF-1]
MDFFTQQLKEAEFNHELTVKMKEKFIDLLFKYKNAFSTDKEPLGAMIGHEVDIILNVEKPYPPLLSRPAYPASPSTREALEVHMEERMDHGVPSQCYHIPPCETVGSTSSKPAPEASKDKPKGPQKNQKGPKNHQGKGKGKTNGHRTYPQGYRIPKFEPSAMDSVFNMARNLMEFTSKEQERMKRTFPRK